MDQKPQPDYPAQGTMPSATYFGESNSQEQQGTPGAASRTSYPSDLRVQTSSHYSSAANGSNFNTPTSNTPTYANHGGPSTPAEYNFPASARSGNFPNEVQRNFNNTSQQSPASSGSQTHLSSSPAQQPTARYPPALNVRTDRANIDPGMGNSLNSPAYANSSYAQSPYDISTPFSPSAASYSHGRQDVGFAGSPVAPPNGYAYGAMNHSPMSLPSINNGYATVAVHGHEGHMGMPGMANHSPYDNRQFPIIQLQGSQQQKRPRRRYEEIERIYICNWQGCTKGYGTLNHLNAHCTMQNHGPKRTPDEFKEIRKKHKQKKREQEAMETAGRQNSVKGVPQQSLPQANTGEWSPHPQYWKTEPARGPPGPPAPPGPGNVC